MKKYLSMFFALGLVACASEPVYYAPQTPTVDYIEMLDVRNAPHQDGFLHILAMNYRSFAIFNARTSGFPDVGEIFAQKAVAAFSGETPFPESLDNWNVADPNVRFELQNACHDLIQALKNDAADDCPEVAAEAQAKFDCWLASSATGQVSTANDCRAKFHTAMARLDGECPARGVASHRMATVASVATPIAVRGAPEFYPDTTGLVAASANARAREGVVIVNNVNIPQNLIQPTPIVFTQNIVNNEQARRGHDGMAVIPVDTYEEVQPTPEIGEELVSRDEFINMMMALRGELQAINNRLDNIPQGERAVLKVQQIPLTPKQQLVEEVMEIRFDFDRYEIKPEYADVIRKLVETTRNSKNVRVSVVGHTDTVGSADYNFALGGRRADAVQQMLIKYGIPREQIVSVSAGKSDPKIPTGPGVKKAENRRVRVVTETKGEIQMAMEPAEMYGIEVLEPAHPIKPIQY